MYAAIKFVAPIFAVLALNAAAWSQETPAVVDEPAVSAEERPSDSLDPDTATEEQSPFAAKSTTSVSGEKPSEVIDNAVESVDRNQQAQQASTGILKPIYALAERFSFPAFHWVAFALMVAGVVSFAFQLVLGKLAVLARRSLSLTEVLSDSLGLAVSLIGLVLTTQAAAENSNFTSSAFAVLSATGAGALVGFVFYLWGQRQELQAVEGRRAAARREPPTRV